MTVRPAPRLVALVTHARTTPAAQRAAFAGAIDELIGPADRGRPWASMLRLTTCHRVELYLGADGDSGDDPRLADRWRAARAALPAGGRQLDDRVAASHLAAVSVGLDSAVIAEDQVLHQLRASATARTRPGSSGARWRAPPSSPWPPGGGPGATTPARSGRWPTGP